MDFLMGGRTGDLIHNLLVIKQLSKLHSTECNLFITNDQQYGGDKFYHDIDKTFSDLKPLIEHQSYISSFQLYNSSNPNQNMINLNSFRWSGMIYQTNWINILSSMYSIPKINEPWVEYRKKDSDKIIIHRSTRRHNENFPWKDIVEKNDCTFVFTDEEEFEVFPFNQSVQKQFCTFDELCLEISSAKFFIGNMSTPLCLAHAMGTPRLSELHRIDEYHYIGEENFLKNYSYICHHHNQSYLTDNIRDFINL